LKSELLSEVRGYAIKKFSFLKRIIPHSKTPKLTDRLQERTYYPDEIIIDQFENYNQSLYIIILGEVLIYD
jgi:hypothetical protein